MTKLALDNITGSFFQLEDEILQQGLEASRTSSRKRMILPLHRTQDAVVQRLLNFMQPGTYVRVHRHPRAHASESVVVLRGAISFREFDDAGAVLRQVVARAGTPGCVLDIEPRVWHDFEVLEPDTVLFEAKMGPYDTELDKEFAPWSAPEVM